jgi:hypothetical protein
MVRKSLYFKPPCSGLTTDDPQPDKYLFRVWITDDKRRLPVRLTASTELGQVRADLAIIPLTAQ